MVCDVRRFLGGTLAAVLALALQAPAAARDVTVRSFDGTKIAAHFFPAKGLAGGERAPTVLIGHGYGGTGDTDEESVYGPTSPGRLRSEGYNVLTWDARGFGKSGGTVQVDHRDYEGRDVQALLDYVAEQPEARLDSPGDPRAGMGGGSYGGAIQLVTAAIDRRVDAIVPLIAWNDLVRSLFQSETVKAGWGSLLTGVGSTATTGGALNPSGPELGSTDPHITSAAVEGTGGGRFSERVRALVRRPLDGSADLAHPCSDADRPGHRRHPLHAPRGDRQPRAAEGQRRTAQDALVLRRARRLHGRVGGSGRASAEGDPGLVRPLPEGRRAPSRPDRRSSG